MDITTEEKTEVTVEKKKTTISAKSLSLCAKVLAVCFLIAGHILKWTGFLPDASSSDICICAFSIMGIFGTVDINILADKFARK